MAELKEQAQADEDVVSQLTVSITSQLREPAATLIYRVIRILGYEQATTLLARTLEIEQQGGMMLPDGTRRRTPGGIFFLLAKQACTPEQKERLFPVRNWAAFRQERREKKQRERAQAPAPALKERQKPHKVERALPQIAATTGQVQKGTTVKITLVGRPASRVREQPTHAVMIFQQTAVPQLPKGLPAPSGEPTNYVVYIATKQWKKVEAAIEDPADALIIEGFPQINAKTGSIAVYATNATTKNLQRAARKT